MSDVRFLPYGRQCIEPDDIKAVADVYYASCLTLPLHLFVGMTEDDVDRVVDALQDLVSSRVLR